MSAIALSTMPLYCAASLVVSNVCVALVVLVGAVVVVWSVVFVVVVVVAGVVESSSVSLSEHELRSAASWMSACAATQMPVRSF